MGKHKSDKLSQQFGVNHNRAGQAPQVPRAKMQQRYQSRRGK